MMTELLTSTVKWYDPARAYGFIILAPGEEVFIHRNQLTDQRRLTGPRPIAATSDDAGYHA